MPSALPHKDILSEDFLHAARLELGNPNLDPSDYVYGQALFAIEDIMVELSSSLTQFDGFILPEQDPRTTDNDDQEAEPGELELASPTPRHFNADQQQIYDAVIASLLKPLNEPKIHFIDGPGGTGKTYLFNAILESLHNPYTQELDVAEINDLIIDQLFPGDVHEFISADSMPKPEDQLA
ncbi:hypothetical protein BDA99DRAFT_561458 [Phascolomyces articulosus]|uniref:ATP-dependent DNA helicase n=1 Tax=Phascolomyces articulosus TaxID=60185 RepID=A0AAD5JWW4_9FUNG|nr:hypothetical protein BDA99DRAFT_561458 [Phascolomyces articulosus]